MESFSENVLSSVLRVSTQLNFTVQFILMATQKDIDTCMTHVLTYKWQCPIKNTF